MTAGPGVVRGLHNLADLVHLSALRAPDAGALTAGARSMSWSELDAAVTVFASGLLRQGLETGDRVVLCLRNDLAFVRSYFGVLRAGTVAVPLNPEYTAAELRERFAQCTPSLVVADRATVDVVRQAAGDVPVVVVGEPSYDAVIKAGQRSDAPAPPDSSRQDRESVAVLLFTAGTSGPAKGAMLSHRALLANVDQLLSLDPAPVRADDSVLVVLPLSHVYALGAGLGPATAVGARIVLAERFDPQATLDLIGEQGVTVVLGAPPMYVAWARVEDLAQPLAGVRTLVSGAAPLSPSVHTLLGERLGHPVEEGYGLTEAAPVVTMTIGTGRAAPGSVGRPLPGITLRLLDAGGAEVDEGDPGEIEISGDNLFSGYWPDGSDGPVGGAFLTGDVGYRDEYGDLRLVDRRRDLILVSGFNVYPFEVETVLAGHPDVAEAAVVGAPHERTGAMVIAYVVPVPGHEIDRTVLATYAAARLARFKRPAEIVVVDSLPHSSNGKLARSRLRVGDALPVAESLGGVGD